MSADSAPRTVRSGQVRLVWQLTSDLSPSHLGGDVGQLSGPYTKFQIGSYARSMPSLVYSRNTMACLLSLLRKHGIRNILWGLWTLAETGLQASDVPSLMIAISLT
jgi:hypothetical protein